MTTVVHRFEAARRDPMLAVLEGFHPIKHALRFGATLVEVVAPDVPALLRLADRLAPDVSAALGEAAAEVSADVFARVAPDHARADAAALALRPETTADDIGRGRIVYLDRPKHLGNIGAAVRVAAAAGAAGVVTSGDRDPWHPAALRGSAGLHFALPVVRVDRLRSFARPVVALDPAGESLSPGAVPVEAVVAFGSERHGLAHDVRAAADLILAIPMRPGVSSLNLATAVAVTLYA